MNNYSLSVQNYFFYLDLMRNISEKRVKFPTNEDFDNASTAFLRLQDIYRFDSKRMAKGSLGMQKGLSLNSAI